jgi:transglutaminase/protease-like cytokinesis protein 3
LRINIKPSYIFSIVFSGAFALAGSFGPIQAKNHEANLVSVAVPEANKKNSKQKKAKNIKAVKNKKTVKKAAKKTVKNNKAVKKVITVKTPVLKKGDDAINQSSYCPRYNRAKSTYLYWQLLDYKKDINISYLDYKIDLKDPQDSLENGNLRRTYNLMLAAHDDLFHVGQKINISYNTESGLITHLRPEYIIKKDSYKKAMESMNRSADSIVKTAKTKKTDTEKIKEVERQIRKRTKYDLGSNGISPYATLVNKKGFCMGYARTFDLCMKKLKIPDTYEITEDHIWNRVKVKGKWLVVDVTYNSMDQKLSNLLTPKHVYPDDMEIM